MENQPNEILIRAYKLWQQGHGLRQISKWFNIPRNTLSRRFKKYFGTEYSLLRNKKGTIAILNEYLRDPKINSKHKSEIKLFLEQNASQLIQSDSEHLGVPLLTDNDLQRLTLSECNRGSWADYDRPDPNSIAA